MPRQRRQHEGEQKAVDVMTRHGAQDAPAITQERGKIGDLLLQQLHAVEAQSFGWPVEPEVMKPIDPSSTARLSSTIPTQSDRRRRSSRPPHVRSRADGTGRRPWSPDPGTPANRAPALQNPDRARADAPCPEAQDADAPIPPGSDRAAARGRCWGSTRVSGPPRSSPPSANAHDLTRPASVRCPWRSRSGCRRRRRASSTPAPPARRRFLGSQPFMLAALSMAYSPLT
jgi:hypothetical protein